MVQKIMKKARPVAGRIKRRLLGKTETVPPVAYEAPAVSAAAREAHGAPFTVAVIGAGNQGRDICKGVGRLDGVRVVAVADRSDAALAALKEQVDLTGAQLYADAADMFAGPPVDLVCVATNTPSHIPLARMAIEAGAPRVMVEKPLGTSPAKAREFLAFCEQHPAVRVVVNHSRRWSLDYAAVRRYLANGTLGPVRQATVTFGSSGLAMMGVHYIDLVSTFIGGDIAWVVGKLDKATEPNRRGAEFHDPEGYALLAYANGGRAFLDFSQDLVLKSKAVVLTAAQGRIEIDERNREWAVVSQQGRFSFPFVDSAASANYAARVIASILSDETPRATVADGVAVLEAVIGLHLSDQQGHQPVTLPLDDAAQQTEIAFP